MSTKEYDTYQCHGPPLTVAVIGVLLASVLLIAFVVLMGWCKDTILIGKADLFGHYRDDEDEDDGERNEV